MGNATLDGATMTEHGRRDTRATPALGLLVLDSPDPALLGRALPLAGTLTLGRGEVDGVDLVVHDRLLSRRHASLELDRASRLHVVDHASKNGTRVDGRRIEQAIAEEGAIVRVGATLLEFTELDDEAAPEADPLLLGHSPALHRLLRRLERIAATDAPVLLIGETGVGKELVARRIHERSRRSGEWVPINCAAIPRELAESILFGHRRGAFTGASEANPGVWGRAHAGTVFLDEIGEMPIDLQPKLLRALESGTHTAVGASEASVSAVRVISATNADLHAAMATGTFRPDLYARLAGVTVELPPLRARRSDIMLLLRHFLRELAPAVPELAPAAIERLVTHAWPRNVRELRNVARHLHLQARGSEPLDLADLPPELATDVASSLADTSRDGPGGDRPPGDERLRALVREHRGNVAEVARALGRDRKQVYRWLKRHGIDPERFRE